MINSLFAVQKIGVIAICVTDNDKWWSNQYILGCNFGHGFMKNTNTITNLQSLKMTYINMRINLTIFGYLRSSTHQIYFYLFMQVLVHNI